MPREAFCTFHRQSEMEMRDARREMGQDRESVFLNDLPIDAFELFSRRSRRLTQIFFGCVDLRYLGQIGVAGRIENRVSGIAHLVLVCRVTLFDARWVTIPTE